MICLQLSRLLVASLRMQNVEVQRVVSQTVVQMAHVDSLHPGSLKEMMLIFSSGPVWTPAENSGLDWDFPLMIRWYGDVCIPSCYKRDLLLIIYMYSTVWLSVCFKSDGPGSILGRVTLIRLEHREF